MKVARWGNSLAVRLPRSLVEKLELSEGDEVELRPVGERALEVCPDRSRQEAIARILSMRVRLPEGYRFDRDEIHERRGFSPDPDYVDEP